MKGADGKRVRNEPTITPEQAFDAYIKHRYNKSKAALELGVSTYTFQRKLMTTPSFQSMLKHTMDDTRKLFLEGLYSEDLNIRHKYFSLIPEAVRAELISMVPDKKPDFVVEIE